MQVTIRGVTYPSVPEAAKALGVTRHAVYNARVEGRLDTVGLGRPGGRPPKPVTYGGLTWPSISAMCRDLDICRSAAIRDIKNGSLVSEARLHRLAEQFRLRTEGN